MRDPLAWRCRGICGDGTRCVRTVVVGNAFNHEPGNAFNHVSAREGGRLAHIDSEEAGRIEHEQWLRDDIMAGIEYDRAMERERVEDEIEMERARECVERHYDQWGDDQ